MTPSRSTAMSHFGKERQTAIRASARMLVHHVIPNSNIKIEEHFLRQIIGSTSLQFLDVDNRTVVDSYNSLEEKLRIFGQADKAKLISDLRKEISQRALSKINDDFSHSILALLMALSGKPLSSLLIDYYESEYDTKNGLELVDVYEEKCSEDMNQDLDSCRWSEGSGCTIGRWESDDSSLGSDDESYNKNDDENYVILPLSNDSQTITDATATSEEIRGSHHVSEEETNSAEAFETVPESKLESQLENSQTVDEPTLVRQVMLSLQGLSYTLFRSSELEDGQSRSQNVHTSSLSHDAIRDVLSGELSAVHEIQWLRINLEKWLSPQKAEEFSPTMQAFCRSVHGLRDSYMSKSLELDLAAKKSFADSQQRCPTLLECHINLKDSLTKISFLKSITEYVMLSVDAAPVDKEDTGVKGNLESLPNYASCAINALCNLVDFYCLDSDIIRYKVCLHILCDTIVPYMRWTQLWLLEGKIGHPEFMIRRKPDNSIENSSLDVDFGLRSSDPPNFLKVIATRILNAGRARFLLKLVSNDSTVDDHEHEESDNFDVGPGFHGNHSDNYNVVLDKSITKAKDHENVNVGNICKQRNQTVQTIAMMPYSMLGKSRQAMDSKWVKLLMSKVNEILYEKEIYQTHGRSTDEKIKFENWKVMTSDTILENFVLVNVKVRCQNVSSRFLGCLLDHCGLLKTFMELRDLFLMGKGELLQSFVFDIFSKIEEGDSLPDGQDLNDLLHESLCPVFINGMTCIRDIRIDLSNTNANESPLDAKNIIKSINLTCKVKWPLGIVIDDYALAVYNRCFTFLMNLRGTLYLLDTIHQRLSKRHVYSTDVLRLTIQLRHLIVNFHRYVMENVIGKEADTFDKAMQSAKTIDDIIKCHSRFLRHVSRYCLISNEQLWRLLHGKVSTIMNLVFPLLRLVRDFENANWILCEEISSRLVKLDEECARHITSLLRLLHKQAQIASTSSLSISLLLFLDFNGFYLKGLS